MIRESFRAPARARRDGLPDHPLQRPRLQGRRPGVRRRRSAGSTCSAASCARATSPHGRDPPPRSEREWLDPLGTATLAGRDVPGPGRHRPDARGDVRPGLAGARPGVPVRDPESDRTAGSTAGSAAPGSAAPPWDRLYSKRPTTRPASRSGLVAVGAEQEDPATPVVDLGCGTGRRRAVAGPAAACRPIGPGLLRAAASRAPSAQAAEPGCRSHVPGLNLLELRSVLRYGAPLRRGRPGPRVVLARHLADATDTAGRNPAPPRQDDAARRRPALPPVPGRSAATALATRQRAGSARSTAGRPGGRASSVRRSSTRDSVRVSRSDAAVRPRRSAGWSCRLVITWTRLKRHHRAAAATSGQRRPAPAGRGARGRGAGVPRSSTCGSPS